MKLVTPSDVLDYWFRESRGASVSVIQDHMALWFGRASAEFDAVQQENADLISSLLNDTVEPMVWNIEEDPAAALAKVIVLDQFSRSVHRGTAQAFAGDEICASLIAKMLAEKDWFFSKYSPIERFFLVVSLQHSELLSNQEMGVSLAGKIAQGEEQELVDYFAGIKGFPLEHYEVVKRFGRFPHRNELLGRDSTQEELDWFNSPECPAWAKSQLKKA